MSIREHLRSQINKYAYQYSEEPFKLRSGRESNHYVDMKPILLHPSTRRQVAQMIASYIRLNGLEPDGFAGVALGACPLVDEVTSYLHDRNAHPFPHAAYVRPAVKDHGTGAKVEMDFGLGMKLAEAKHPGKGTPKLILLEDVWTTGGSAALAEDALVDAGFKVMATIAVVDREEEGSQLRPTWSMFTLEEVKKRHV